MELDTETTEEQDTGKLRGGTLFPQSREVAAGVHQVQASDGLLLVDVTNGPVTLMMPQTGNMRKGDSFLFKHVGGSLSDNGIEINADTVGKIDKGDTFSLYNEGQAVWVIWTGSTYIVGSIQ